jgi:two-component system, OmpR family, heavy metal sensor histidine kinase CusS
MKAAPRGRSLVGRLVLLFVLGSAFILAGAGYSLYHALRMRLDANDMAEMRGKSAFVADTMHELAQEPQSLDSVLARFAELPKGHPRAAVAVQIGERWVLPLDDDLAAALPRARSHAHSEYEEVKLKGRSWLIHRVQDHGVAPALGARDIQIVLSVETTDTRKLLHEHALVGALVALLGTAASALLAWFVARRGLAPLAHVAARAEEVTARRLGSRLDLEDAPLEVHGLADSINRMLERLEESFQTLEQFSDDIAHELRTPLNNLLLQTQVTLGRPRSAEEYQDALHTNLEELERLHHMVVDMLFLARADRGMIELKTDDIDLRPEIESVAEYFEAAAAEQSQRVSVAGEGHVVADRLMVRRAVTNLLSNAVRYSPRGAMIEIAVACDARWCSIAVSNPGDAIPPEELRRLFTRFARREVSRGRELEGAGLGLAIVESIMKLLGGSVEASSAHGAVTFALRFPARGLAST